MAKKKPKANRWASEAAQQTLLKFGPQIDALNQIQKEAESAYGVGVAQGHGNADSLTSTIGQAVPQVGAIYDQAGLDQARSASTVNNDIATLPGLSGNLRAAIALEQQNAGSRVSTGRAQALTGLAQQKVAARAGGVYGAQKAHDDLVSQLSKIFDQRTSLASQSGTFQALTQNQLQDKATARADTLASQQAGRDVTIRGQDLSHADRAASLAARGKPKKGAVSATGAKLNPAGAHNSARDAIQKGLSALSMLDPEKAARHDTAPLLVTGHKSRTIYDPATGKPKLTASGTQKQTPDVPAVGEWATIAADVYYDGHLSRANQKKLAQQGYSIKQLGLPTYAQWRKAGNRPKGPKLPPGATLFPPLAKP
jgi:hypothetical protein